MVVVGAGAAGLFCAGIAGQRGLKVLLLDHSEKVAEKVRISGGGRANFTNRDIDVRQPHKHFVGENPNFCRSALSRYTPADFIALVQKHGIPFHEKHKGQLFCDRSAGDLIDMLLAECAAGGVTAPAALRRERAAAGASGRRLRTRHRPGPGADARKVVIATGGLSILGRPSARPTSASGSRSSSDLRTVEPRPGLVPLTFDGAWLGTVRGRLAGLALPVLIETGDKKAGAGPCCSPRTCCSPTAASRAQRCLQISSYWKPGTPIRINLAPEVDLPEALARAKHSLGRFAQAARSERTGQPRCPAAWPRPGWRRTRNGSARSANAADKALARLAERLARWELVPTNGTEGYKKAEVTLGGVDTRDLSQQTMESKQPGLYFIGEVVDVTGWLGGYNFQWAWASAHACAQMALCD